jgi:methyltransferase (TIGR00027 family)
MRMKTQSGAGRSAYGVAFVRATEMFVPQTERLFEDDLVIHFLPTLARFLVRRAWIRKQLVAFFERTAPGISGALLCRTRCIDDMVKDAVARGLRTVVILGAGLDTRPYRLVELAEAAVLELDLPAVQAFKIARLKRRFGALPQHVRFVPVDFNTERLDVALAKAGLNADDPALFICEGVTQYLQPPAVDTLLGVIAARPKGSELVFTYVLEEVVTGQFRPDRSDAFRKSASRRPEPWLFGIEPSELKTFLDGRGLTLCEDVGAEDHVARYLRPIGRDLPVSEIERVARARVLNPNAPKS